jgi:hypothetical protein
VKIRDRLATAVEGGDVNGDDIDAGAERRLLRLALGRRLTLCPERRGDEERGQSDEQLLHGHH